MARLCERPGCSLPAAVVYGMDTDHLLVWLAAVPEGGSLALVNVVCRRHADAMVVPRDWTLDDRRDDRPRLFKVVDTAGSKSAARSAKPSRVVIADVPQPELSFDQAIPAADLAGSITVGDIHPTGTTDPDETQAMPWRPAFDAADDLDEQLSATSPLLSRAFNGRPRADP